MLSLEFRLNGSIAKVISNVYRDGVDTYNREVHILKFMFTARDCHLFLQKVNNTQYESAKLGLIICVQVEVLEIA